jgi:hypothetical protein
MHESCAKRVAFVMHMTSNNEEDGKIQPITTNTSMHFRLA